jgi:hypothetical protein
MGRYILEAYNDKNSHNKTLSAYETLRVSFLPNIGQSVYVNGLPRIVTNVVHNSSSGSLPKVTVEMPTLHDVEFLISNLGWRKEAKW